jgi:hypothetical protein
VTGGATTTVPIVADNWNVPEAENLAAIADPDLETSPHPCVLSMEALSADGRYQGLTASHDVDVTDDDVPEIALSTAGGLAVTEAGPGSDTFEVVLGARPSDDVTITFSHDGETTSAPSVTFTRLTWDTPRTVTVTAVNDDIDEGASHAGTITLGVTSSAVGFATAPVFRVDGNLSTTLTVDVADDDTAGIGAAPTALVLAENGGTDTYSLVLESEPTADVVVTIAASGLCATSVNTHTFAPADWDTPFEVAVTAGNDDIDGTVTCSVANSTSSADPNYVGLSVIASGDVTDDDTAGVVVSAASGSVAEQNATSASYTVVLTTQPTADVVVVATADAQLAIVGSDTLTFSSLNWDTPQTITISAVDDSSIEVSPHVGVVTHEVTSGDANFNALAIADRSVGIVDNDTTLTLAVVPATPNDTAATSATATVVGGATTPTGTVQFMLDSVAVGSAVTLVSGTATIDLGTLTSGAHVLAATYSGDASHSPSSDMLDVVVTSRPVADDDSLTVLEDAPATAANVLVGDVDGDGDTLSVTDHTAAAHGTVTCSSSDCTYRPAANFHGSDSFTYTVADGTGLVDTATVNVTVTPVDDSPTVPALPTVIVPNGQPVTFELLNGAVDVDGDVLRITAYSQPGHGGVVCTTTGSCTYTPDAGYAGPDQFSYEVSDGQPAQSSNSLTQAAPVTGVVILQVQPAPTTTAPTTTAPTGTPSTTAAPGTTAPAQGPGALPSTGSESRGSATWALLAVLAGFGLATAARRRRV